MLRPLPMLSFVIWAALSGSALAAPAIPDLAEPARTGQKSPKDAAVVIGVEDYTDVPDVPYARRDAEAFDTFIRYTRGIPDDRVELMRDARAFEIERAVKAAGQRVGAGGRVWVYFAGHGAMQPNGTARLLLGRDAATDPEAFARFAVSVDDVRSWATAGGGEAVLVIDACYNGGGRTGEGILTGGRRMAMLDYSLVAKPNASEWAATGPKELSQPLVSAEHGAFTYFAVGALRGWADGEIDGARDGNVTGEEANRYVARALQSIQTQGQTPQLASEDGARLVLARGVKEVGPSREVLAVLRGEIGAGDAGGPTQGAVTALPGKSTEPATWSAADDQVLAAMEATVRADADKRGKAEQEADAAQRVGARQAAVATEWASLQSAFGDPAKSSAEASSAVRTRMEGWKSDELEVPGRRVALTGSLAWNGRTKDLSRLYQDVPARTVKVTHPKEIAAAEGWLAAAKAAAAGSVKKSVVAVPTPSPAAPTATSKVTAVLKEQSTLERKAETMRLDSIERLKELIRDSGAEGETKSEMLLRLGDLHYEQGRAVHLREGDDHGVSTEWYVRSIKLYRQILTSYPQYSRADEATFYLAQALSGTGSPDEGATELLRLLKTYPESRYAPDAYLLIGEYYFDKNEAYKALMAYQRAASVQGFDKHDFASYKLAWCYYNLGEYGKAIETMKGVLTASVSRGGHAIGSQLSLEAEAGKDLVRFYRDNAQVEEGAGWFRSIHRSDLAELLEGP